MLEVKSVSDLLSPELVEMVSLLIVAVSSYFGITVVKKKKLKRKKPPA